VGNARQSELQLNDLKYGASKGCPRCGAKLRKRLRGTTDISRTAGVSRPGRGGCASFDIVG
jgi:hypothetical protein